MSIAILGTLGQIVVFALVAFAARRAATTGKAIALGIVVGVAAMFGLGFFLGVLGNMLPVGQMDFWLAQQIERLN